MQKPKSSAKDVLAEAGKHTNYAELALFDKVQYVPVQYMLSVVTSSVVVSSVLTALIARVYSFCSIHFIPDPQGIAQSRDL